MKEQKEKKSSTSSRYLDLRYDVHLHLFNKTFLAKELYFRLIQIMHHLFAPEEEDTKKALFAPFDKISLIIQAIKRINNFLHIGFQSNSIKVCNDLNRYYKNKFILTPLMFDMTYCFVSAAIHGKNHLKPVDENIFLEMKKIEFLQNIENLKQSYSMNLRVSSDVGKSSDELLLEIDEVTKEFKMLTDDLTKFNQIETVCKLQPSSDLGGIPGEDAGFKEQIRQLDELKNTRRYKSKVFPFLAVDPRRPGILEYLKKNVGRGKRFIGIKLYSPNGYSPTDPLLFESSKNCNCIYKFCEKNHIPVTVHNSFGGFATFMNQIEITGDIYTPDGLKYLNKELYSFQYSFLTKPGNAIRERALLLNHPSLWEKVLKKYPNLYINFAHFGGSDCLEKAIDNVNDLESGNWGQKIIELIKTYPNAYTDLSCFIEFTILKKLKNSSIYLDIKEHVLYGSDFYFIMLAENDFKKNIKNFKDVFADDFNLISRDNPKRFLKHVIKWKDLTSKVSKSLKGGFI